jgi:WD40 repeat protein
MFAVGGEHTLLVFDATTFEQTTLDATNELPGPNQSKKEYFAATLVTWHPQKNLLAVSSQGNGANLNGVFNIETGKKTPLALDIGRGIAWNFSGNNIATSSPGDGHLRIWNHKSELLNDIPRFKEGKGLTGVAWKPSGETMVSIGGFITLHQSDGTPIRQIQHRPEAAKRLCLLLSVAWHPTEAFFVTGDYGNEIDDPLLQFWSSNGELMKSIPLTGGAEIRNVSWNKDGSQLAIASDQLRIFDKAGNLLHQAKTPDLLWGVDWHPDGDRLLTSSMDGRITLWDSKGKVIKEIARLSID